MTFRIILGKIRLPLEVGLLSPRLKWNCNPFLFETGTQIHILPDRIRCPSARKIRLPIRSLRCRALGRPASWLGPVADRTVQRRAEIGWRRGSAGLAKDRYARRYYKHRTTCDMAHTIQSIHVILPSFALIIPLLCASSEACEHVLGKGGWRSDAPARFRAHIIDPCSGARTRF
jgi:hypothetical protein